MADGPSRSPAARRRLLLSGIGYALLLALVFWAGNRWADQRAIIQASRLAQSAASARASLLVSELQKYRLIPVVLGEYPEVHEALGSASGSAASRLNLKLESLADSIGSSIIYLMNPKGQTIAASNWRLPTSFVGQDYSFRPYFTQAERRGSAEFFGLGTVSRQPGLFLSRRVGDPIHGQGGVIVVKFGFDAIERGWAAAPGPAYVTNADGVVLLTNRPAWRFRITRPLPPARIAEMRRVRQFGAAPLDPLPLKPAGEGVVALQGADRRHAGYASATIDVPVASWKLTALEPIGPIRAGFLGTARLVMVIAAVLLLVPLALWIRARDRADIAAAARQELERQVALRTQQLERTQSRFREAREELAHANRLGSIGQITAAVTHEINQPVAAIRTFAENGVELLRRGDAATAGANLSTIAELTGRIGAITAELKGYARRGSGRMRATPLDAAIDGALLMTGHRLRAAGIALVREGEAGAQVTGDPIRLEQILVNLIHNAVEALAGRPDSRLLIRIDRADDAERLLIADTGAGIDPAMGDRLFTPFATSRPEGLGLGLGIARDIAREFGGELENVLPPNGWRTAFLLTLRRA